MIDTASKDVLQKSGLSSTTTATGGRLGGIGLLVVYATGVTGVVILVIDLVTTVLAVLDIVGTVVDGSGLCEVGLYTGMSPQILSFFAPI